MGCLDQLFARGPIRLYPMPGDRTCAVWVVRADGPRALRNSVISSKSRLRWFSINACLLRALMGSGVVRGRGMQLRRRCAGTVKSQRPGAKIGALNIERPTLSAVPVTEPVTKQQECVTFR